MNRKAAPRTRGHEWLITRKPHPKRKKKKSFLKRAESEKGCAPCRCSCGPERPASWRRAHSTQDSLACRGDVAFWLAIHSRFPIFFFFSVRPGTGQRGDCGDPWACHWLPPNTRFAYTVLLSPTIGAALGVSTTQPRFDSVRSKGSLHSPRWDPVVKTKMRSRQMPSCLTLVFSLVPPTWFKGEKPNEGNVVTKNRKKIVFSEHLFSWS